MSSFEHLAPLLAAWMPSQRWFAGKDWPITAVRPLALQHIGDDPGYDHLVVAVDQQVPGTGLRSTVYQVPVSRHAENDARLEHVLIGEVDGVFVYDALHDRTVTGRLLDLFAAAEVGPALAFRMIEGTRLPDESMDSLVLTGEQSNTSLAYGDQALLKVFRRLAPGTNPDIEVHAALAGTDCQYVAPALGWLDGTWDDPVTAQPVTGSLAMLQQFLVTATDGWRLALTSVADLFAERDLHADEVGGDFAAESYRLGVATASVHASLREVLPTSFWSDEQRRSAAHTMQRRLNEAVVEVPALLDLAPGLSRAFADLAELDQPVRVQRIHGDLHLGQVLRTSVSWKIIDFEGEPEKPMPDRIGLDTPLRDVAGMLRSFDYVALHTLLAEHADDTQLAYRAGEWADRNREAFLDGYSHVDGVDPRAEEVVLRAYETDKAVYELIYEARNRPTWTVIPMTALERLSS